MSREHSHNFVATLGSSLVFLGLVGPMSLHVFQTAGTPLSETILTSTTGADPSQAQTAIVNCGQTNADSENGADPAPPLSFVDSNSCSATVVISTGPPVVNGWKYPNSPCILCPVVGKSITVGGAQIKNGFVKVGTLACQFPPQRGTKDRRVNNFPKS